MLKFDHILLLLFQSMLCFKYEYRGYIQELQPNQFNLETILRRGEGKIMLSGRMSFDWIWQVEQSLKIIINFLDCSYNNSKGNCDMVYCFPKKKTLQSLKSYEIHCQVWWYDNLHFRSTIPVDSVDVGFEEECWAIPGYP